MKPLRKFAFVLVVALQVVILLGLVLKRVHLLKHGKVVRLSCRPVDPRSLLSGDYVELTYRVADIPRSSKKVIGEIKSWKTIFVAVKKREESDVYDAVAYSMKRHDVEGEGRVILRGRTSSRYGRIKFGVEQYFVPQFEGLKIERQMAKVTVDVAVSESGECAIKKLYIADEEVVFY